MSVKEILESIGIVDAESNNAYRQRLIDNGVTDADVEVLHPNKIDLVEFWQLAREWDNCSIVGGNCIKNNQSIQDIIYYNSYLYRDMGVFDTVLRPRTEHFVAIMEYGCGYGPIFHHMKASDVYNGIDVVDNIGRGVVTKTDGKNFPIIDAPLECFQYCVAFNVFQHMIDEHVINAINGMKPYLNPKGLMITSFHCSQQLPIINKEKNLGYTYTLGQLIPSRTKEHALSIIDSCELEVYKVVSRNDGFVTLYSRKKS